MKLLALTSILFAGPAAAQAVGSAMPAMAPPPAPVLRPGVPPGTLPVAAPDVWNPAAPYVTAGQDEPGYKSW